jgi:ribonuclease BN (tRNA processing enzyme)
LKTRLDRHTIQHILFSHYHADHFSDFITFFFDAVCHCNFGGKRPGLTITGPKGTKRLFGTIFRTFPSFKNPPFRVTLKEVDSRPFYLGTTRITPLPMTHTDDQRCLGYRIEYQGRILCYSGDARYSTNLLKLCREADLAILDCSFPKNRPGIGHMHAGECGQVACESNTKHLVLSHFYQAADRIEVKRQAAQAFAGKITRARDLMTISL